MIDWVRLDHVQLTIPRGAESAARAFYGDVLGLVEVSKPDSLVGNGGLWFRVADAELHLGVEDGRERSKRHPAFEVGDLARARATLESNGVDVREETPIPDRDRFSFRDPFGNRIELLEKRRFTGGQQ